MIKSDHWPTGVALLTVALLFLTGTYTPGHPFTALAELTLTGMFFGLLVTLAMKLLRPPFTIMRLGSFALTAGFLILVAVPHLTFKTLEADQRLEPDPYLNFLWGFSALVGEGSSADARAFRVGDQVVFRNSYYASRTIAAADSGPPTRAAADNAIWIKPGDTLCAVRTNIDGPRGEVQAFARFNDNGEPEAIFVTAGNLAGQSDIASMDAGYSLDRTSPCVWMAAHMTGRVLRTGL